MSLHRVVVGLHGLEQRGQCDVANVLVGVQQKSSEDVHGEHTQTALRPNLHDRDHGLVEYCVAHVLRALRVRGDRGENVVHLLAGVLVVVAEDAQDAQDFHLKKRIGDAADVVLGRVAGHD